MPGEVRPSGETRPNLPWHRAFVVSIGTCLALWVLLGLVPDRLIKVLDDTGLTSWLRDIVVTAAFTLGFAAVATCLRLLQKTERI